MKKIITEREDGSISVAYDYSDDPILTEQHHKDELNINNILKKYSVNRLNEFVRNNEPTYDDFQDIDLHTAMIRIESAKKTFMELPSSIRKEFNNNSHEFYKFVGDPNNVDKMREMGLMKAEEIPQAIRVQVVEPEVPVEQPT